MKASNKALHRKAIPLCSIAVAEFGRYLHTSTDIRRHTDPAVVRSMMEKAHHRKINYYAE